MAVKFFYNDIVYQVRNATLHKQWLDKVVRAHKYKVGDINIIFCTDKHLLGINKQYLAHDYYTDIITFDYTQGTTVSGDLFISIDRVKDNASAYSIPVSTELRRVMVHGVLHLLGHTDKKEKEIAKMRAAEDKWLRVWALSNL